MSLSAAQCSGVGRLMAEGFIRHDSAELCSLMIPSAMDTRTGTGAH